MCIRDSPKGVKLSPRVTAWKAEDIRALIEQMGGEHEG
jgi:predicted DNA-binding transcriptional regulator AlpA